MNARLRRALLRVPPFPGASCREFATAGISEELSTAEVDELIALMRSLKVGGAYWGAQPELPEAPYVLIRVADAELRANTCREFGSVTTFVATGSADDPWHLLSGAKRVVVDADDELAFIAAIAGIDVRCVGEGTYSGLSSAGQKTEIQRIVRDELSLRLSDPFTEEPASSAAIVRLSGFWRKLIDDNRDISGAAGFASWKRGTVAPLLWGGRDVNFITRSDDSSACGKVAVWKSRTPAILLEKLGATKTDIIEVEDGFIRSAGLGADCVPPLSIVVDRLGVHFDSSKPSELEILIQNGRFDEDTLKRARTLRDLIVASGVSKYGAAGEGPVEMRSDRRTILVPGQVEDDRAVLCSAGAVEGNLDLLRRVRSDAPDAHIIYKPHPDIEAGHRVGAVTEGQALEFADEIVRGGSISRLLDTVDEVHVNSSLAGFEALLRSKPVTTHGIPFYAGWGLTRDLGDVPARRSATRTIDELVAAVLLLYPRYLDPVTGLPCPPEILVRRIAEGGTNRRDGMIVQLRRLQGRLKKRLSGLGLAR